MTILILGLIIFLGGHSLTMLRDRRAGLVAQMGAGTYKGLYSLVALIGLAMIVYGFGAYREAGYIQIWNPPTWTKHLSLLIMLPAMILLVATYSPGRISRAVRHPMLVAVKTKHLSLLIMLPAMILLVATYSPGRISRAVRHPMLVAVKLWALSHLLANGDLGSMLLFGLFLAYAVVDRIAVKRRGEVSDGHGVTGTVSMTGDIVAVVGGVIFYAVFVMWLHPLLIGVSVIGR